MDLETRRKKENYLIEYLKQNLVGHFSKYNKKISKSDVLHFAYIELKLQKAIQEIQQLNSNLNY